MAKSSALSSALPESWTRVTLPRVVIICGPETALRDDALQDLRKAAFGSVDGTWVVLYGRANQNEADELTPATVLDEVCTRPMFAADDELKVVLVRNAELFLAANHRTILDAVPKIPDKAVLLFELAAPGNLKSTTLFKEVAQRGGYVEIKALSGGYEGTANLEFEINKRAAELGLALTQPALLALLNQSSQSLSVIEQELAKLAVAIRQPAAGQAAPLKVTEQDVAEICATTSQATAFGFANALFGGESKAALETVGVLFDRGIGDPKKPGKTITRDDAILTMVLAAVTYKLTQLQDLRHGLDLGRNERDLFKEARLFGDRESEARRALRRFDSAGLRQAMESLFKAFMEVRHGGGEPRVILERLVFRIGMKGPALQW